MSRRLYSLRKAHQILSHANTYYQKNWQKMAPERVTTLERLLADLDRAVVAGDRTAADPVARELETFGQDHFKRSFGHYVTEMLIAITLALLLAVCIRQMWFELYQIPTGSMRPSFREQEHLTVTKTAFGLNVPLRTEHFFFEPDLMRRAGVVVFSAENLDMPDTETTYFWLFPATKRLIKRCMGLPGDTIYFYGGKIYGIDKDGKDITPLLNPSWMDKLDHVPYISFEGKVAVETTQDNAIRRITLKQMNRAVGKLTVNGGQLENGLVFNGKEWVEDRPTAEAHTTIQTYSDVLGIGNYAMAQLLTPSELKTMSDVDPAKMPEGLLYLQLHHHPSLSYPQPRFLRASDGRVHLLLPTQLSVIPVQQRHLKALMDQIYTVRFVVKEGKAAAYNGEQGTSITRTSPSFGDVPDGMYELYYGKAYSVAWAGVTTLLPEDHPLNRLTVNNVQRLFNLGIEMNTAYDPSSHEPFNIPSRFSYFRDGALWVMGAPIYQATDEVLAKFNESETQREKAATKEHPYVPFKDQGAPYKNGDIDGDFLRTFGFTIPDKHYMMLGDNYARSADSRAFGFVPEPNVQGAPDFILWPVGPRWGTPLQTPYPLITLPRLIVWAVAATAALIWWLFVRWRMRRPVYKKLS